MEQHPYYFGKHVVPPEVVSALERCIREQKLVHADNFRFAMKGNTWSVLNFEQVAKSGCCLSLHSEVEDRSGKTWLIGCNYGH